MREKVDILIAGSGVSGLYAALCAPEKLSVLMVSKTAADISNSALAQGGVAAVLDPGHDTKQLHFNDTMVAGRQKNDPDAVRVLVDEGPENVLRLPFLGVDFDRCPDGLLDLTLEGGHSRRRIAHHRDNTGYELVVKLAARAAERPNIETADQAVILRLEKDGAGFLAGILRGGDYKTVRARSVILATGGIGRVYRYSTNSEIATGDGIYFASKLGAKIKDLSYIQFHPTAFAGDKKARQRFLISESVRGEGAKLLNRDGERFMTNYDKRGELAPRDVVSSGIMKESARLKSDEFFLDISEKDAGYLKNRFPSIYNKCLEYGVDITKDRIPVFPCQHYLMGGIDVDTSARTAVEGLYAVGECSHTGVHGANRLASNSLLEALVFSRRAVEDIAGKDMRGDLPDAAPFALAKGAAVPDTVADEIRGIMQKSFFVNPDYTQAQRGLAHVSEIVNSLETGGYADCRETLEAKSIANAAKIILTEVCAHATA